MRGWLTGIAATVVMMWLALLSTVFVLRPDPSLDPEFAFVPGDGVAHRIEVDAKGRPASRENALIRGNAIQLGAPIGALSQSAPPEGVRPDQVWWWRETTVPAGTGDSQARHTVHSVSPDGVRLHGALGTPDGVVFSPGLLELPTDAAAGKSWSSEGQRIDADGGWDYRNNSTAAAPSDPLLADQGCVEVTSRTTVKPRADTPSDAVVPPVRNDVATWCPGRGVVSGTSTSGQPVQPFDGPWPGGEIGEDGDGPRDRAGSLRPLSFAADDPAFGSDPAPTGIGQQSAVTTDGRLVTVEPSTQGLSWSTVRTDPTRGDELQTRAWAKPPGDVLTLESFGDIVVATTSTRAVVAYDSSGRRLWRTQTSDLVLQPPVRLDEGRVVLTTGQGEVVALELTDGSRSWTEQVPSQAAPLLTVAHSQIYLSTGQGNVERLDADGRQVWQTTVNEAGSAPVIVQPVGRKVLLANGSGGFTEIDRDTAKWLGSYVAGNVHSHTRLLPGGARVALDRSATGVQILDPEARRVTGVIEGGHTALAVAGGWMVATDDALVRTDINGAEIGRQPFAAPSQGAAMRLEASADLLWVISSGAKSSVQVVK